MKRAAFIAPTALPRLSTIRNAVRSSTIPHRRTVMTAKSLRIIHFNDVYNIDVAKSEPIGGAARFVTAVRDKAAAGPGPALITFAGDAFSPAPLTPYTNGEEIPPVLNAAGVTVACIGNHELDNGVDVMKQRVAETDFPWLLSNLDDRATKRPLGDVATTHVETVDGVKVGFMGLASLEWVVTLGKISIDDLIYTDYLETADRLSAELRAQGCDVIVALTHMMQPDDEKLAREAQDVDLVLAGHDHIIWQKKINNRWAVKAGTDFKTFATIDLKVDGGKVSVDEPVIHEVTKDIKPDPETDKYVKKCLAPLNDPALDRELAMVKTLLDGRFVSVRTQETAIGNLICDALADMTGTPIAICNGGSMRANNLDPPSPLTQRELEAMLPFQEPVVVVRYSGDELLAVLESGVSEYPLLAGRFCQVSGLRYSFDPRKPGGQRIDRATATARTESGEWETITPEHEYLVATIQYIFIGKDGYPVGDENDIVRVEERKCPQMVGAYMEKIKTDVDNDGVMELGVISPAPDGRITCVAPDPTLVEQYKLPKSANTAVAV